MTRPTRGSRRRPRTGPRIAPRRPPHRGPVRVPGTAHSGALTRERQFRGTRGCVRRRRVVPRIGGAGGSPGRRWRHPDGHHSRPLPYITREHRRSQRPRSAHDHWLRTGSQSISHRSAPACLNSSTPPEALERLRHLRIALRPPTRCATGVVFRWRSVLGVARTRAPIAARSIPWVIAPIEAPAEGVSPSLATLRAYHAQPFRPPSRLPSTSR